MNLIRVIKSPFTHTAFSLKPKILLTLGVGISVFIGFSAVFFTAHAQWYPGTSSGITSETQNGACGNDVNGGAKTQYTGTFNSDGSPADFYTNPSQYCELY